MVSKMKTDELKMYLRLRGLKVTGRKAELVSQVFSACENNVQPIKTAEEVECDLRNKYQLKLIIGDDVIPDPFQVSSGWCNEEEGLTFWPMISYGDIFNFLMLMSVLANLETPKAKHKIKNGGAPAGAEIFFARLLPPKKNFWMNPYGSYRGKTLTHDFSHAYVEYYHVIFVNKK